MFVAVVVEYAQDDHKVAARGLFRQYGLTEITSEVFESLTIHENNLARLKRDVDRVTDYYDTVRFYQYPVDGSLVITTLAKKKWRRTLVKAPQNST